MSFDLRFPEMLRLDHVIHVAPEFRYTHWSADSTPAAGQTYIQSKQDQVEFLVGFSF
jgi:hypothetical protein